MRRMFSLKQLQEIADNRIKTLVEGGTLENAKPIYFHPVLIISQGLTIAGKAVKLALNFIILNNDDTPFTYSTLCNWVKDNDITLITNGDILNTADSSFYGHVYACTKHSSGERLTLQFYRLDGTIVSTETIISDEIGTFTDAVNKIN